MTIPHRNIMKVVMRVLKYRPSNILFQPNIMLYRNLEATSEFFYTLTSTQDDLLRYQSWLQVVRNDSWVIVKKIQVRQGGAI